MILTVLSGDAHRAVCVLQKQQVPAGQGDEPPGVFPGDPQAEGRDHPGPGREAGQAGGC